MSILRLSGSHCRPIAPTACTDLLHAYPNKSFFSLFYLLYLKTRIRHSAKPALLRASMIPICHKSLERSLALYCYRCAVFLQVCWLTELFMDFESVLDCRRCAGFPQAYLTLWGGGGGDRLRGVPGPSRQLHINRQPSPNTLKVISVFKWEGNSTHANP